MQLEIADNCPGCGQPFGADGFPVVVFVDGKEAGSAACWQCMIAPVNELLEGITSAGPKPLQNIQTCGWCKEPFKGGEYDACPHCGSVTGMRPVEPDEDA